ncbi:transcription factor mitochondrial, partial [Brachionus plicatilis]
MLKNLICNGFRCFNKLNLFPKELAFAGFKNHTTISSCQDVEKYKPIFLNYSTNVSYPKYYVWKMIDIQRHERISGYLFFVMEQLKSKSLKQKRIKDIAERWNSMSDKDRKPYIDLADKNRKKLTQQKMNILSTLNKNDVKNLTYDITKEKFRRFLQIKEIRIKKEKIRQNAPKRPSGAFFLYCETLNRGEANSKEFVRDAADKWKKMSEQDRQKFVDQANELMQQYKRDYSEWESKMVEKGKNNLIRKKSVATIDFET